MKVTATSQPFADAAARAIHLLGSASHLMRGQSLQAEDLRDQVDLFGLSLLASTAAGRTRNLLTAELEVDESPALTDAPLALVAEAHDLLLDHTTAMDPADVLGLVIEVGSVRQQLRHYVDRH